MKRRVSCSGFSNVMFPMPNPMWHGHLAREPLFGHHHAPDVATWPQLSEVIPAQSVWIKPSSGLSVRSYKWDPKKSR